MLRLPATTRLAIPLVLLGMLLLLAPSNLFAQARVNAERSFQVSIPYEDVLKKLEGEAATRRMFASQDVHLLTYQPNPSDANNDSDKGITRASIDISGSSCEFGIMRYRLSVVASAKQTQIEVQLLHPVGMLRQQHYLYRIVPINDTQTSIQICHDLDVVLKHSRLKLVNRIIQKVTYDKACEEVVSLTHRMSECVANIALAPEPPNSSVADTESSEEEEAASNSDIPSESSETAESPTPADAMASSTTTESPTPADVMASPTTTEAPTPADAMASSTTIESPIDVPPSTAATNTEVAAQEPTPTSSEPSLDPSPSTSPPVQSIEEPKPPTPDDSATPESDVKTPSLRITVEGLTRNAGTVRIAIFRSPQEYRLFDARKEENQQGKAFRKVEVKSAGKSKVSYEFKDVPPGKYAIAAFHDQDGNKKLNASLLGLPNEPYGFSRNARGTLGAPNFEDAVVDFDADHTSFTFRVK